tara:strand:+ start:1749 stop:2363 length:615 start_codon:yes stop_codon:yes gene_type:complete
VEIHLILNNKGYSIGVGVIMKKIDNVKLGLDSKTMEVVVSADIIMDGKDDWDDLYLIMFNVMEDPLRLALFSVGNLKHMAKLNKNMTESKVKSLAKSNPQAYISAAIEDTDLLGTQGMENVKVLLNSDTNAQRARLVLSSMIDKGYYVQKSTYNFGDEVISKQQKVETEALIMQLKMMLEIIKRWDGFDIDDFQRDFEKGNIKI